MESVSFIRWQTAVDFLVLASALYLLLSWARSARALRIALAVVGLHALALVTRQLNLVITSWLLDFLAILAVILLLLVFQPELRRVFMDLDAVVRRFTLARTPPLGHRSEIATACFELARRYVGALIVIIGKDSINELLDGGIVLNADISSKLLRSIFQKDSPLHDGAVIVDRDRISKANVVLPLTHRPDIPVFYGTRHRAAVGLAERCDAMVVVVSEERGQVSLMKDKYAYPIETPEKLIEALRSPGDMEREGMGARVRSALLSNGRLKLGALGLASLIWSMSFLAAGTTIRSISVPIEFSNVPAGMAIAEQSADTLEIQVRGSPWIMDSMNLGNLIARFNLGSLAPGQHGLTVAPAALRLPPGVVIDHSTPARVLIRLAKVESRGPGNRGR